MKMKNLNDNEKNAEDEELEELKDNETGEEFSKFQECCLSSHNEYRAKHGVESLRLSKKLCECAQEWADKLLAENLFQHRPEQKYGENIYSSWSSGRARVGGGVAVDSWYSEIDQHNFEVEGRGASTGHFTQVV